jgi:outer membrane protein assembly factor BamB
MLVTVLVAGCLSAGFGPAAAAGPVARPRAQANLASSLSQATGSSPYDWPELHHDSKLAGYAANGSVSTSDAGSLGVRWATDLYSAMLDSPVVAYDSTLGKTLAYIGTDNGNFYAVDTATGAIVWDVTLPGPVRASPLVRNGAVWAAITTPSMVYKLNASTGAVECSQGVPGKAWSSPVAATPSGSAASVYFAGGSTVLSVSAATCAIQWTFKHRTSTWDPLAYAVDAAGEPLVLFGSADPVDSAYAVDAATGKEVWRYRTTGKAGDYDVGSGLTVSPPGANGFAGGVAYVPAKDGFVYALDLTTGTLIWSASMGSFGGVPNESLSTAALDGTNLVVGNAVGVSDFNAVTGALRWSYQTPVSSRIVPPGPSEVVSSPAISGPAGHEVAAFGDVGGAFRVLSLATGQQLYSYQTGSWITSSPAVSNGDILIGSSDGFLYDLATGLGGQTPATAITSPASGSVVANPDGKFTVRGTASDSAGVAAVVVAVRQGGTYGTWWDAATSRWSATTATEQATLASPKATSTNWSASFAVPASGNAYRIDAYAVSVDGPSTVPAAEDEFFVGPVAGGPALSASSGFAAPGGSASVAGVGFGPSESITIRLLDQTVGTVTSQVDGSFPATKVILPTTAGFGPAALVATGATTGKAAAVGIDVSNSWPEQGGGPGRTGFEPNDPVISGTIDPAQNILLYPAWHFSAAAGLTSPAVVDQVVYVGDQKGNLHAVQASDGTQRWVWQVPTGAAITGSPAVDSAAGLAFVGAADGSLYAVYTSGPSAGRLAWSASVGSGGVESPVFDGTNVYAASTGGNVVALSESAGSAVWSATTGSAVTGPPALDSAAGVLAVPTATDVIALGTTTGNSLWSFAVTEPAPPMTAAGVMFVGSGNNDVYAVSETSGHQLWSHATGGAIQDSGALSLSGSGSVTGVYIGSAGGRLYFLNPSTGVKVTSWPMSSSTIGLAIGGNTALATTSSGLVEGVRDFMAGSFVWAYAPSDGTLSPPAVVDGTFFVAGQNGTLWAFTPYGAPPP